ncbi:MAG: zinc ribbon domain-containing protein [Planctomycetes bacterium]|nr:zinc ribbon domain-containing protein [Planctomycetota bacterium]
MPTYVYETISADATKVRRFEIQQRMSEAPLTKDPATGEPVQRVISGGLGFTGCDSRTGGAPMAPGGGGCALPGCGHAGH